VRRRWRREQRPGWRPPQQQPRPGEAGSALIELTWLGLLLLIPLVYVVITLVTVQRSAYGATEAARAAGRAFILSPDSTTARQRAFQAAQVAMRDQGVELAPADVVIVCGPTPDSCLQPGSTVQVEIALQVRLPLMPTVLGQSAASVSVDVLHTEPYGIFREASR
jgi:hypothetical protein